MKSPSEILAILDDRIAYLDAVGERTARQLEEALYLWQLFGFGEYPWPDNSSESLRDEDVRLDNAQRRRDISGS